MPTISDLTGDAYLSDLSPRDKPWDSHRSHASKVQAIYQESDFYLYAGRIMQCSQRLEFAVLANEQEQGSQQFRLKAARFCRVRHCPVCQWRRSLMWVARTFKALPGVLEAYPKSRWVFLTLTARNCPVNELREVTRNMNRAFERMTKRKVWPAQGFIKSVEVTRSAIGEAHPHFHVLMMVPPSYLSHGYINQQEWRELWQSALKVEYLPVVNVKAVKPKKLVEGQSPIDSIADAIRETLKYSVKPEDMVADREWFLELTSQLHNTRSIGIGGVLKEYFSEDEPEDLINTEEQEDLEAKESDLSILFGWREWAARYSKIEPPKDFWTESE
jgi:plasmid rolling circle replication initiator protein Rep